MSSYIDVVHQMCIRDRETFQSSGQKIAELKAQMQTLYAAAKEAAEKLTQSRLKGFAAMNKEMKAALEFLNMPGIRFALKHTRGPLSSHGQDTVEFLISTNPGEEPKPLAKIASGGELSRIMLAFKSCLLYTSPFVCRTREGPPP